MSRYQPRIFINNPAKTVPDDVTAQFFKALMTADVDQIRQFAMQYRNKYNLIDKDSKATIKGQTPYHIVLGLDDNVADSDTKLQLIEYLDLMGAPLDLPNGDNVWPIHLAVASQSSKLVNFFVEHRANLNRLDSSNNNPLHYAVTGKLIPCAEDIKPGFIEKTKPSIPDVNISKINDLLIPLFQEEPVISNLSEIFAILERVPDIYRERFDTLRERYTEILATTTDPMRRRQNVQQLISELVTFTKGEYLSDSTREISIRANNGGWAPNYGTPLEPYQRILPLSTDDIAKSNEIDAARFRAISKPDSIETTGFVNDEFPKIRKGYLDTIKFLLICEDCSKDNVRSFAASKIVAAAALDRFLIDEFIADYASSYQNYILMDQNLFTSFFRGDPDARKADDAYLLSADTITLARTSIEGKCLRDQVDPLFIRGDVDLLRDPSVLTKPLGALLPSNPDATWFEILSGAITTATTAANNTGGTLGLVEDPNAKLIAGTNLPFFGNEEKYNYLDLFVILNYFIALRYLRDVGIVNGSPNIETIPEILTLPVEGWKSYVDNLDPRLGIVKGLYKIFIDFVISNLNELISTCLIKDPTIADDIGIPDRTFINRLLLPDSDAIAEEERDRTQLNSQIRNWYKNYVDDDAIKAFIAAIPLDERKDPITYKDHVYEQLALFKGHATDTPPVKYLITISDSVLHNINDMVFTDENEMIEEIYSHDIIEVYQEIRMCYLTSFQINQVVNQILSFINNRLYYYVRQILLPVLIAGCIDIIVSLKTMQDRNQELLSAWIDASRSYPTAINNTLSMTDKVVDQIYGVVKSVVNYHNLVIELLNNHSALQYIKGERKEIFDQPLMPISPFPNRIPSDDEMKQIISGYADKANTYYAGTDPITVAYTVSGLLPLERASASISNVPVDRANSQLPVNPTLPVDPAIGNQIQVFTPYPGVWLRGTAEGRRYGDAFIALMEADYPDRVPPPSIRSLLDDYLISKKVQIIKDVVQYVNDNNNLYGQISDLLSTDDRTVVAIAVGRLTDGITNQFITFGNSQVVNDYVRGFIDPSYASTAITYPKVTPPTLKEIPKYIEPNPNAIKYTSSDQDNIRYLYDENTSSITNVNTNKTCYRLNSKVVDMVFSPRNLVWRNSDGDTPLHLAVMAQNPLVIKQLMAYGANPKSWPNLRGKTPYDLAKEALDLHTRSYGSSIFDNIKQFVITFNDQLITRLDQEKTNHTILENITLAIPISIILYNLFWKNNITGQHHGIEDYLSTNLIRLLDSQKLDINEKAFDIVEPSPPSINPTDNRKAIDGIYRQISITTDKNKLKALQDMLKDMREINTTRYVYPPISDEDLEKKIQLPETWIEYLKKPMSYAPSMVLPHLIDAYSQSNNSKTVTQFFGIIREFIQSKNSQGTIQLYPNLEPEFRIFKAAIRLTFSRSAEQFLIQDTVEQLSKISDITPGNLETAIVTSTFNGKTLHQYLFDIFPELVIVHTTGAYYDPETMPGIQNLNTFIPEIIRSNTSIIISPDGDLSQRLTNTIMPFLTETAQFLVEYLRLSLYGYERYLLSTWQNLSTLDALQ